MTQKETDQQNELLADQMEAVFKSVCNLITQNPRVLATGVEADGSVVQFNYYVPGIALPRAQLWYFESGKVAGIQLQTDTPQIRNISDRQSTIVSYNRHDIFQYRLRINNYQFISINSMSRQFPVRVGQKIPLDIGTFGLANASNAEVRIPYAILIANWDMNGRLADIGLMNNFRNVDTVDSDSETEVTYKRDDNWQPGNPVAAATLEVRGLKITEIRSGYSCLPYAAGNSTRVKLDLTEGANIRAQVLEFPNQLDIPQLLSILAGGSPIEMKILQ
ncbi:hypothetical protein A2154_04710 [Candidatus Gottesmanbacteria bacterium RBG_16_43_7]|uniref:Uncharacterized protein n=1 Tax=Candidatus Gottesmanbacteria bacterium RBG_16_43_7 TaxID=1798373 RepID=A0A1F5Z8E7_9BACT|nr:MAG: hypothetical protein A2154_04710 [Candidatus Gottesmanbacteria bacterium RBG_16_43_7]